MGDIETNAEPKFYPSTEESVQRFDQGVWIGMALVLGTVVGL